MVTGVASIEERPSGPRVVWRLNRPGDPLHGKKQHLECDNDTVDDALSIVEGHRSRLTRDEAEVLLLGPTAIEEPPTALTFREWCEIWLKSKTRISPRTRRDYMGLLENRILPAIGDTPIDQIPASDIGKFVNSMRGEGLSNRTITRHYSVIFQAFASAVKNKKLEENPCDGTDFVRDQVADDDQGDEDHVYLTPTEYQILYRAVAPSYRDFVEALAGSAGRFGEVTALQPRDRIAPTRRDPAPRLHIRRAWKQAEDGSYYLGTTKGRGKRKNMIDDALDQLLLRCSKGKDADALIFTAPKGGRINHHNFYNRVWQPAVIKAMRCATHPPASEALPLAEPSGTCGDHGGLSRVTGQPCQRRHLAPGLNRCVWHAGPPPDAVSSCDCPDVLHRRPTPHDLRHTCAAWMLEDPNVAPLYVSRYLGHASMEVTDKVYAGLMPSGEGAAVKAIATARGRGRAQCLPVIKVKKVRKVRAGRSMVSPAKGTSHDAARRRARHRRLQREPAVAR